MAIALLSLTPIVFRFLSWIAAYLIVDRIAGLGESITESESPLPSGTGLGLGFGIPIAAFAFLFILLMRK